MILVIDNYDSFTYNLVQYLGEVGADSCVVRRNDEITVAEVTALNPSQIVISPGPCTPNEAGISMEVVLAFMGKIPILGVCLGHQAIAQALGATIVRAKKPMHGKTSTIRHNEDGIFLNVSQDFIATRYHSLVINKGTLPKCLEVSAWSEDDEIMAIKHTCHPNLIGLQFHPESILTKPGRQLLDNFLRLN
jgi:anthranilate synthase/aminodeoxychorismate synthase-like glutamine amidotransferase